MLERAEALKEQWRCPGSSTAEPDEPPEDPEIVGTLAAVERLTRAQGMRTCPLWYASQPCAHRAAHARKWREHGGLGVIDYCDAALIAAVDEIDSAYNERLDDEDRRRKTKP